MEFSRHFCRFYAGIAVILTLSMSAAFVSLNGRGNLYRTIISQDSIYTGLTFDGREEILSSRWTKSVLFNPAGTRLYTMNLEKMSIYEFEACTRRLTRKFSFEPHEAPGWDYDLNKSIPSFAEKPVEGCFSHDDKILWVSLHNAGGIVAIPMDTFSLSDTNQSQANAHPLYPTKSLYVYHEETQTIDTMTVPFIKTGKTPKTITVTDNNKYMLVTNWHSNSVSVLRIQDSLPPYGRKIKDILTGTYPRGIAVIQNLHKSYVANMSSNMISVINNKTWNVDKKIRTIYNPRHVLSDGSGRLFVSYNISSKIACIDALSGKTLFWSSTSHNPRTIALSGNKQFLFVTCYEGNTVDIFKITGKSFSRLYSIHCEGKPVGIDLREDKETLEAWVCTYERATLQVLRFRKKD